MSCSVRLRTAFSALRRRGRLQAVRRRRGAIVRLQCGLYGTAHLTAASRDNRLIQRASDIPAVIVGRASRQSCSARSRPGWLTGRIICSSRETRKDRADDDKPGLL
jgi:hypothetical protein